MNHQTAGLMQLLGPVIARMGFELWGVELLARGHRTLLRIYIDNQARGVTLADCEQVSREVTGVLDVEDPVRGSYDLEVSSPGLDRPLFTREQFERFAGTEVSLRLRTKIAGRRRITGVIASVDEEAVRVITEEGETSVPVDAIEKARLVPQF